MGTPPDLGAEHGAGQSMLARKCRRLDSIENRLDDLADEARRRPAPAPPEDPAHATDTAASPATDAD